MFRRLALFSLALAGAASAAAVDPSAMRGELQVQSVARDDARSQARAVRDELERLNAELAELKAVTAAGSKGLQAKRGELAGLNARETALAAEMGANRAELARLLGALELYRRDPPPALLVSPASARDAVRAAILVRAMQPELERRAVVFRARAEELQKLRRSISFLSEDLFTSESALADGRAALETAISEKIALGRQLDADASDADKRAQTLTAALKSLGVSVTGPTSSGKAPAALGEPVSGVVVRAFGDRSPGGQTSDGLTFRTAWSAPVRAPGSGIVEYSGALKGWGGVLIFNLGGGYHLVLAGLDKVGASVGRRVAQGELVGAMAERGPAEPELYLEIRKDGAPPQDPSRWLRPLRPAPVASLR